MFAPNILAVENKRVVLGEVCRNLSVAFAEVHPPFIFFCPVFILLSSFSLLFSLSFFLLHALFFSFSSFPFPLGAYLRPPVSDPPSALFSPFLSFFFPFARSFFSFTSFQFPLGAYLRPPVSLRSATPL